MKNFQSIIEGTWIKLVQVQLTEAQKELISSTRDEDDEAKRIVLDEVRLQREGLPTPNEETELNECYDSVKPNLKEDDVYQLISINVFEKEDKTLTGILNYRLNGEHKQIRF